MELSFDFNFQVDDGLLLALGGLWMVIVMAALMMNWLG